MKVFVTGVGGQLGYDVVHRLRSRGIECVGTDILDDWVETIEDDIKVNVPYVKLDITNADEVDKTICEINPDVVVHCAAWTAVDMAEDDDKVEKVRAINAGGTQNIANVCKKLDAKIVYISTDYVFDGQGTEP